VRYSAPVINSVRRLCVAPPLYRGRQSVVSWRWQCDPQPDDTHETTDEFGNRMLELKHARLRQSFRFAMKLLTHRDESSVAAEVGVPSTGLGAFRLPSALCDRAPNIQNLAERVQNQFAATPNSAGDQCALIHALCSATHHALQYRDGASDTQTTAAQALDSGSGVCQDMAHVMIALCRTLHLPARYVAGYIDGQGRMHAWVEVLCGEHWQGWDPTHNRPVRISDVAVAHGRDYRDVPPISGTFRSLSTPPARTTLSVHCQTRILDE
jgi:transglutaminase-like putative cysteine protease